MSRTKFIVLPLGACLALVSFLMIALGGFNIETFFNVWLVSLLAAVFVFNASLKSSRYTLYIKYLLAASIILFFFLLIRNITAIIGL